MSQGQSLPVPPGFPARGVPVAGGQSPSASDRVLLSGPWATTDKLRPFQSSWRVRDCGRWVAWRQENVQVRKGDAGWSFGHLHRCGSPWSCPTCAHQISMHRASEVAQAVEWWRARDLTGQADVVLLTLTVRHHAGDSLRTLRQGVSQAWRAVEQSRGWRAMREACGLRHHIRCQEVTWGENGWHPHLHILLFCEAPELALTYRAQLLDWWRYQVRETLGDRCLPSKRRALDIDACNGETYIAKMGLEVGSPAAKHAREGHLSAMELAHELANGTPKQIEILEPAWRHYTEAMHGAHQLQWSRGLKDALGVAESDGSIVARPQHPERAVLCEIPKETWRDMAKAIGVAPIDALGRKKHGLPISVQLAALLDFFRDFEEKPCSWVVRDGKFRLRWQN